MSSPFCGCYYYNYNHHVPAYMPRPKQYLPLLETKVRTLIIATASRTVLKQTFTNPSTQDAIKECVYAFPLYDGVSVVSFTGRVGKKLLTGLVKEKVKAKQIFDQAVSRGQTAGLLEQSQESADVFTTKLGNIPAGQSVVVEITYIGELKHHETEGLRFTIPTNIAPRYGPATYDASNADVHDSSGISITVDICMEEGSFIKRLESPSHPIAVSMGVTSTSDADPMMSKASATLSLGSSVLYKDFVLIVQCKDIGIPKALLETHPTIPHQRALMATLVPKFALPPSRPEIVFVADRSGSMQGNIPMLISAMNVFLKSMPAGVKFNICSFGSRHDFLWSQSHSYTKESLAIATQHVAGFSANYGGTETFSAIRGTIERRYKDIPLELILLTDGDITSQTELFAYLNEQVQQSKGSIRVFPLGIGDGVSHSLIEGVARAGNGFAQAVQIGERFENSVVRMLRGALTPHITDYKIEVKYEAGGDRSEDIDNVTDGMRVLMSKEETSQKSLVSAKPTPKATISLFDTTVDPEKEDIKGSNKSQFWLPTIPTPKFHQAPHRIPSLFAFSRTTVYLLLSPSTIQRKPVAVILRGTSAHGPLELEIPVEALPLPGETIHQLAAKKAVQDLEEGRGWLYDAKDQNGTLVKNRYPSCFQELVEKEAVRLGEKFQIAGKWCSFVAVAANDKEIAARQNKEKDGNEMTSNQDGDELDHDEDIEGAPSEMYEDGFMVIDHRITAQTPIADPNGRSANYRKASYSTASGMPQIQMQKQQLYKQHQQLNHLTRVGGNNHDPRANAGGLFGLAASVNSAPCPGSSLFGASKVHNSSQPTRGAVFGNMPMTNHAQSAGSDGGAFGQPSGGSANGFASKPVQGSYPDSLPSNPDLQGQFQCQMDALRGISVTSLEHTSASPPSGRKQRAYKARPYFATTARARASGAQNIPGSDMMRMKTAPCDEAPQVSVQRHRAQTPYFGASNVHFGQASSIALPGLQGMTKSFVGRPKFAIDVPKGKSYSSLRNREEGRSSKRTNSSSASTNSIISTQSASQFRHRTDNNSPPVAAPPPGTGGFGSVFGKASSVRNKVSKSMTTMLGGASMPSSEPEKPLVSWTAQPLSGKVLALINMQEFDGFWPACVVDQLNEIAAILGVNIEREKVKGEVSSVRSNVEFEVWVTLLVVAWFVEKAASEEGTWALVVEKAKAWLAEIGEANQWLEMEKLEGQARDEVRGC